MWDDETRVWVATSEDVVGLATEADTLEILHDKLVVMISELIEMNDLAFDADQVSVSIIAERTAVIANPRAAA